jgi:LysR family transcriptional regulator, low CO2-responsive transcriptional regulator
VNCIHKVQSGRAGIPARLSGVVRIMMIESQHLRVFASVARHLSMTRAATELELTPSAVSHCLRTLEEDLGCRLFERTSRAISLTAAGVEFLADVDAILERMSHARTKLRSWTDGHRGRLRIAANTTACHHILPLALREFRETFREMTISVEPASTPHALRALSEGEADLAILVRPVHAAGTHFIEIGQDDLYYILDSLHPWCAKRKANPADLQNQRFLLPGRSSGTKAIVDSYFRKEGIRLRPSMEVGSEDGIKQMIRLGLGIGLLPKWSVAHELREGTLVSLPVGRRRLRREWGILHLHGHKLSFAENVLVDLIRNVARDLMAETTPE